jgi:hypothetical protein
MTPFSRGSEPPVNPGRFGTYSRRNTERLRSNGGDAGRVSPPKPQSTLVELLQEYRALHLIVAICLELDEVHARCDGHSSIRDSMPAHDMGSGLLEPV